MKADTDGPYRRVTTFEAVALPKAVSAPEITPQQLVKLRKLIPVINDTYEIDPLNADKRWDDVIEQINQVHSAIIMQDLSDDFETNWQYGRLLHNTRKFEDAVHYLLRAVELDGNHAKVLGRLAELYLDLHKEQPNGGYLTEASQCIDDLSKLEQSDYVNRLIGKAQRIIVEGNKPNGLVAANS